MPSLILLLALTFGAAWLAARPDVGAWFTQLQALAPALGNYLLAGGWTVSYFAQGLASWLAWRTAGRHAAAWLAGSVAQLSLWVAWSWALFHLHRPGWSLGVLTLACLLQWALLFKARGLGIASLAALLPPAVWLPLLWWANYGWWLAGGGGPGSIIG
jgi:tryptophan-rich sensory protein